MWYLNASCPNFVHLILKHLVKYAQSFIVCLSACREACVLCLNGWIPAFNLWKLIYIGFVRTDAVAHQTQADGAMHPASHFITWWFSLVVASLVTINDIVLLRVRLVVDGWSYPGSTSGAGNFIWLCNRVLINAVLKKNSSWNFHSQQAVDT